MKLPLVLLKVLYPWTVLPLGQLVICAGQTLAGGARALWEPTASLRERLLYALYAFALWAAASFFYGYEFLHRLIPTLITGELRRDLTLQATQLGSITASYFYAYALAQLPAGMLVDRYGLRRTLFCASLTVAIGGALFSGAQDVVVAFFARALIGLGSGFAFAATLKVLSLRFAPSLFPLFVGLTNTLGIVVALLGQRHFAMVVHAMGWRQSILILSLLGLLLSFALWIVFKEEDQKGEAEHELYEGLALVVRTPQIWWISFIAALRVSPIISFGELWAGPFLEECYQADTFSISHFVSTIFMGIAVGGPFFGLMTRYFLRRELVLVGGVGAFLTTSLLLLGLPLTTPMLYGVLFLLGLSSSSMLLCFGMTIDYVPSWAQGAAVGFMNLCITLYGAALLPLIGAILEWQNPQCGLYAPYKFIHFQKALFIVPLSVLVSILMTLVLHSNYFKPRVEE